MEGRISVGELVSKFKPGDEESIATLLPIVYAELKMLAARQLSQEAGGGRAHTLQPTALVHEAFLKLVGSDKAWSGRDHFLAIAARAMRQVLVDHARKKIAEKRGGGMPRADLSIEAVSEIEAKPHAGSAGDGLGRELRVSELDALLTELSGSNDRVSRVAEMRLFGGMEMEQIATALGKSRMTIQRDWQVARAFLAAKMQGGPHSADKG